MQRLRWVIAGVTAFGLLASGCKRFEVTAVPLSRWNCDEPEGIPFYLPKPLLIVTKNVYYVESEKLGLTDTVPIPNQFDDQSKYADLNARTDFRGLPATGSFTREAAGSTGSTVAAANAASVSGQHVLAPKAPYVSPDPVPSDGLVPETFFTVQIVFVPDLTQKYGLRIRGGGPGEVRAALNLVNGWMFTGLGPFYVKDSSTAQNLLAAGIGANLLGGGVAEVVRSLADLRRAAAPEGISPAELEGALEAMRRRLGRPLRRPAFDIRPGTLRGFAEVHVYEPHVTDDGNVVWQEVCALKFDREYLGYYRSEQTTARGDVAPGDGAEPEGPPPPSGPVLPDASDPVLSGDQEPTAGLTPEAAIVARVLGVPADALRPLQREAGPADPDSTVEAGHTGRATAKTRWLDKLPFLRRHGRRVSERVARVDLDALPPELRQPPDQPTAPQWLPDNPGPEAASLDGTE